MKIVVNSDVVFTQGLGVLPRYVREIFRVAGKEGHTVLIPRTSSLEFERNQREVAETRKRDLLAAAETLKMEGVAIPNFDPDQSSRIRSLKHLIEAEGIFVSEVIPTLEDYTGAERRACFHLPPSPAHVSTNTDASDEMRDLVIWEVAIRIARESGGAVLFSRDKVHSGNAGKDEAEKHSMMRAADVDALYEIIGQASPSWKLAFDLLTQAWSALRGEGLPINDDIQLKKVVESAFRFDQEGNVDGEFSFTVRAERGFLSADAAFSGARVELNNVRVNTKLWKDGRIHTDFRRLKPEDGDQQKAFQELRSMIGGAQ